MGLPTCNMQNLITGLSPVSLLCTGAGFGVQWTQPVKNV